MAVQTGKTKRRCECCLCPAHPADGQDVYRVNPTGELGIWACEECYLLAERLWLTGRIDPGGVIRGEVR